jgi:hypothetical protein
LSESTAADGQQASTATGEALLMPRRFVLRRVDVLLLDLVEQLAADYPEVPIGVISRCVDAARGAVDPLQRDAVASVAKLEKVVRDDLDRIVASLGDVTRRPAAGS